MNPIHVQKFGGSALKDASHLEKAVDHIAYRWTKNPTVVVVSAFSGITNQLTQQAESFSPDLFSEHDVLLSCGEQMAAALLALRLHQSGLKARSFMGWQIPIDTTEQHRGAEIKQIGTENLQACLSEGCIPIVAGFQGVSPSSRITTLEREGSDLTAAALACVLQAERCTFFKDVHGLYDQHPKIYANAHAIPSLSYAEAKQRIGSNSVLHPKTLHWGEKRQIPLHIRSVFSPPECMKNGTWIQ